MQGAGGRFKAVSCVRMGGAWESCCGDWVNRVRLASVRASTDCWRRLCPARCSKIGEGPLKNAPYTRARSKCNPPPPAPLFKTPLHIAPTPRPGRWAHISPSKRQMAK